VSADELRLVWYEALVSAPLDTSAAAPAPAVAADRLFDQEGDQMSIERPVDES
jgi:hypothetical protein